MCAKFFLHKKMNHLPGFLLKRHKKIRRKTGRLPVGIVAKQIRNIRFHFSGRPSETRRHVFHPSLLSRNAAASFRFPDETSSASGIPPFRNFASPEVN